MALTRTLQARPAPVAALLAMVAVLATAGAAAAQDCLHHDTLADFTAGAHDGTAVTEADSSAAGARLSLAPVLHDVFTGTTLDTTRWVPESPPGYAPPMADGVLDIADPGGADVSSVISRATFGAGHVLEGRVLLEPGSEYLHFGFISEGEDQHEWILFSTQGTGADPEPVLQASIRDLDEGPTAINIPLDVSFGEWHDLRLVRGAQNAEFWVDGELQAVHDVSTYTLPMTVFMRKVYHHPSSYLVDWVRVTPHTGIVGTYTSDVLGGLFVHEWQDLQWTGGLPEGAAVAFATRSGDTAVPGVGWSEWSDLDGGNIASPPAQFLQYRVTLTTNDLFVTPAIDAIDVCYLEGGPDVVPPQVLAVTPPDGAVDVPTTTEVTASFSEPMDPATVLGGAFTLVLVGHGPLPAEVSVAADGLSATLAPTAPLPHEMTFEARLAGAAADLAGNPLGADVAWSFATGVRPPDLCLLDTSREDFAAGEHDGTAVAEAHHGADGGELRLPGQFADAFVAAPLDTTMWTAALERLDDPLESDPFDPIITDGVLDVADPGAERPSSVISKASFGPGTVIEGRVRFEPGTAHLNFGFLWSDGPGAENQNEWLLFGTANTGGDEEPVIHARCRDRELDIDLDTPTPATLNAWHVFRIVWEEEATFWVDGQLVATFDASMITHPAQVFIKKKPAHDSSFLVDWVRVGPYAPTSGTYTSPVRFVGAVDAWHELTWLGSQPDGTSVTLAARSGETPQPDATWSGWEVAGGGAPAVPLAPYVQYRVELATTDPLTSPAVGEVRLTCLTQTSAPAPSARVRLHPGFPNPFNPRTTLSFELAAAGEVRLCIHDLRGRLVRTLVDGERAGGTHRVVWNGRDDAGRGVAAGVYVARLVTAAGLGEVRKLTLVR